MYLKRLFFPAIELGNFTCNAMSSFSLHMHCDWIDESLIDVRTDLVIHEKA